MEMCGLFCVKIIKGFHHYHFSYFYFFLAIFPAFRLVLGAVLGISAVSATFSPQFFQLLGWFFGSCLVILQFQLLFSPIFRL